MPCDEHHHTWPKTGTLTIYSCEKLCAYCEGAQAAHRFSSAKTLRSHVRSQHPKIWVKCADGRAITYQPPEAETSGAADFQSDSSSTIQSTSKAEQSCEEENQKSRLGRPASVEEADGWQGAEDNSDAMKCYAAQFRVWLQFGEANGYSAEIIYKTVMQEMKSFLTIEED